MFWPKPSRSTTIRNGKAKKQVIVDPLLWQQLKGKMTVQGKTVSEWFEEQARAELFKNHE